MFLLNFSDQLVELMHSRARRRFSRGLKRKPMALIKKLRKAKKEAPPLEKPAIVKTHLRNMIVVPEMVGSIIGVYNGKTFNQVSLCTLSDHVAIALDWLLQQRMFTIWYKQSMPMAGMRQFIVTTISLL